MRKNILSTIYDINGDLKRFPRINPIFHLFFSSKITKTSIKSNLFFYLSKIKLFKLVRKFYFFKTKLNQFSKNFIKNLELPNN